MNYLKIGLIKKPHGLKGELKILPLTDNPERFKNLKNIYLFSNNQYVEEKIQWVKITNTEILLKLSKYNSLTEVELLRNIYLYIDKEEGEELGEWEYYSQDLIGCSVYFKDKKIGNVIDISNFGANDNILIKSENEEFFYPFLREYIEKVDIDNKKIVVNEIEGFYN